MACAWQVSRNNDRRYRLAAILAAEDAGSHGVQAARFRLVREARRHSFGHDLIGQTRTLDLAWMPAEGVT
jgi:hypothetical protein